MTISSLPLASTRIMAPSPPPAPQSRLSRGPPRVEAVLLGPGPARLHATQRPWLRLSLEPRRAGTRRRDEVSGLGMANMVGAQEEGAKQLRWPLPPSVPPQVIDTSAPLKAAAANDRVDGDGDGDASIPGSGAAVRTHPLAPDAHERPAKTPVRTALSPR
jgi:hypothetical protein